MNEKSVHPRSSIRRRRPRGHRRAAGFTLIEAALTTVIVGTGVLAIVAAQQAYHMKNDWAQRTGTAMLLANELRELTLTMPMYDPISGKSHVGAESDELSVADFDDLDDFAGPIDASGVGAGLTFNPPINALRQPVDDLGQWSQHITVENVLTDNISASFTQPLTVVDGTMRRVTVAVSYQRSPDEEPQTITSLTWVIGQ